MFQVLVCRCGRQFRRVGRPFALAAVKRVQAEAYVCHASQEAIAFDEQGSRACPSGGHGRADPGGTPADDQYVCFELSVNV